VGSAAAPGGRSHRPGGVDPAAKETEEMSIGDIRYVVIHYDEHGVSAAMTKEGHVFIMAMPFKKETSARDYIDTIKKLLNKESILFKRAEEG